MEKRNKKGLVVIGLLALCVILTVGLFTLGNGPKGEDNLQDSQANAVPNITPNEILPSVTPPVTVRPGEIRPSEPVDSGAGNIIELTVMPDKPEPPELPDTAYQGEPPEEATPEDVAAHEALDPALKNPDVKPNITPAPVQTARPQNNEPQDGSTNAKGEVYVPGFGWIMPSTPQGQQSSSDGDWDKIIGH